jgi:hypothetical protein
MRGKRPTGAAVARIADSPAPIAYAAATTYEGATRAKVFHTIGKSTIEDGGEHDDRKDAQPLGLWRGLGGVHVRET